MKSRLPHQPRMPKPAPLPVRLADMQEIEDRYRAASPDERMAMHRALPFYRLLTDEECFVLERRFPTELDGAPTDDDATEGVRVAWDLRARELVACMLQYGQRALSTKMELVRSAAPTEDVAVLAMTATGSFLELDRPDADGKRRFRYRSSARVHGTRQDGEVVLAEPVLLGNRFTHGDLRTSELLIVAAGPALPAEDFSVPGPLLYGPVEEAAVASSMRVGMTRFRVLVDAAENATGDDRRALQERAAALARDLQALAKPEGGLPLRALAWFVTGSDARYDVMQHGALDLVRHGDDHEPVSWLHDADIGEQSVTEGAPLVVFHAGARNVRKVAFIFRVAMVGALVYSGDA